MSLGWISVDDYGWVMPMERFEPSTLAGPVFETGAYTVPPHRLAVWLTGTIILHLFGNVKRHFFVFSVLEWPDEGRLDVFHFNDESLLAVLCGDVTQSWY